MSALPNLLNKSTALVASTLYETSISICKFLPSEVATFKSLYLCVCVLVGYLFTLSNGAVKCHPGDLVSSLTPFTEYTTPTCPCGIFVIHINKIINPIIAKNPITPEITTDFLITFLLFLFLLLSYLKLFPLCLFLVYLLW